MYHAFVGNDAPPVSTGLTRGIVAAGLGGLLAAVIRCLPIDEDLALDLMSYLSPTVTALSYILYGYMDKWLKGSGR